MSRKDVAPPPEIQHVLDYVVSQDVNHLEGICKPTPDEIRKKVTKVLYRPDAINWLRNYFRDIFTHPQFQQDTSIPMRTVTDYETVVVLAKAALVVRSNVSNISLDKLDFIWATLLTIAVNNNTWFKTQSRRMSNTSRDLLCQFTKHWKDPFKALVKETIQRPDIALPILNLPDAHRTKIGITLFRGYDRCCNMSEFHDTDISTRLSGDVAIVLCGVLCGESVRTTVTLDGVNYNVWADVDHAAFFRSGIEGFKKYGNEIRARTRSSVKWDFETIYKPNNIVSRPLPKMPGLVCINNFAEAVNVFTFKPIFREVMRATVFGEVSIYKCRVVIDGCTHYCLVLYKALGDQYIIVDGDGLTNDNYNTYARCIMDQYGIPFLLEERRSI